MGFAGQKNLVTFMFIAEDRVLHSSEDTLQLILLIYLLLASHVGPLLSDQQEVLLQVK